VIADVNAAIGYVQWLARICGAEILACPECILYIVTGNTHQFEAPVTAATGKF